MTANPSLSAAFIAANMPLAPVRAVPEIVLHTVHPGSGLRRVVGDDAPSPYWAYQWAGGTVLARHILDHPDIVRGRRVIDLGAGSGIVAIAAAKAGAASVAAAEIDPRGQVAIALNAAANGAAVEVIADDLLAGPPPSVDLVLVSDLFYAEDVARRVMPFIERCRAAGIDILIGDPYRKPLPVERLVLVADYEVPDFGSKGRVRCGVFSLPPR